MYYIFFQNRYQIKGWQFLLWKVYIFTNYRNIVQCTILYMYLPFRNAKIGYITHTLCVMLHCKFKCKLVMIFKWWYRRHRGDFSALHKKCSPLGTDESWCNPKYQRKVSKSSKNEYKALNVANMRQKRFNCTQSRDANMVFAWGPPASTHKVPI